MTEKVEHPPQEIDRRTFRSGHVLATAAIHLTGGIRATQVDGGWSILPLPDTKGIGALRPFPREAVYRFAVSAGLKIIGGDQVSGLDDPLPARFWTPLYGQNSNGLSPADAWGAIATSAFRSGDEQMAQIARKIAVTLNAAGIRIRDASDCYHHQLVAALVENRTPGHLFKNIPLMDLFLAFHSLLSEMASARDYIAEFAGRRLGAPNKVDALNRFEDWAGAASRVDKVTDPLARRLLGSRARDGANRWLGELTDYRNEALHRMPMAATPSGNSLVVVEREVDGSAVRLIELQIPELSADGTPRDALSIFVSLHEKLLDLFAFAAEQSSYLVIPPIFVIR